MAFSGIKGLFMARCQAHNDNIINVLEEIIDFKIISDGTFLFRDKKKIFHASNYIDKILVVTIVSWINVFHL